MIIILQTITIPLSTWLLESFIDEVPRELEEAARIDGVILVNHLYVCAFEQHDICCYKDAELGIAIIRVVVFR